MANLVYNKALEEIAKAASDLDGSTLKVMLVNSTYTANKDHLWVDDGTVDDPASHEISVSGYSRQTLSSKAITRDDTNDFAYLDGDDVVFAALAAGQTVGGAVLFRDSGSDATSPLLGFYDLSDTATSGVDLTVQWAAPSSGAIMKLTG